VPTAIFWFLRANTNASSSSLRSILPANRSPQVCSDQPLERQIDLADEHTIGELVGNPPHLGNDVVHLRPIGRVKRDQAMVRLVTFRISWPTNVRLLRMAGKIKDTVPQPTWVLRSRRAAGRTCRQRPRSIWNKTWS
jgi:hypothetical protein